MSWLFWLVVGFAIEWAIEMWYWRGRRAERFTAPLEARIRGLEEELRRATVVGAAGRTTATSSRPAAAAATPSATTAAPAAAPAPTTSEAPAMTSRRSKRRDDLKAIRGIGEVFQDRLYDAGVTTYDALAALSAEEVAAIIKAEDWQNYDFGDWIRQAAELARKV